jgi:hypothetical protein
MNDPETCSRIEKQTLTSNKMSSGIGQGGMSHVAGWMTGFHLSVETEFFSSAC